MTEQPGQTGAGTEALVAKAVRQIHQPRHFDGDGYGWTLCSEDRQRWPCATERTVSAALAEIEPRR